MDLKKREYLKKKIGVCLPIRIEFGSSQKRPKNLMKLLKRIPFSEDESAEKLFATLLIQNNKAHEEGVDSIVCQECLIKGVHEHSDTT
jgi:hypothetical protein